MIKEFPTIEKKYTKGINRLAIVFPNLYYGGVYSLGSLIVYNLVNTIPGWSCQRRFLDQDNLEGFDLVGFSAQYELDYQNILKIIKKQKPKISFAGGPCVTTNHKPLEGHVDFFILGNVEPVLPKVLEHVGKKDFFKIIATIKGVFVPEISKEKTYGEIENLDEVSYPLYQPLPENLDKTFVFGKTFMLEIERGCPYSCHFCSIPGFYGSFKFRSLEKIKEIIDQGLKINKRNKIAIYAPSFVHPKRKEILKYILEKGCTATIPSTRLEILDKEILELILQLGQKSLTIAPEGHEELRYQLNKKVPDEKFFSFLQIANELNVKKVKCYMLFGSKDQTTHDLDKTIAFVKELKKRFNKTLYVSFNPIVSKPRTGLAGNIFDKKQIFSLSKYLEKELKKLNIQYKINTSRYSLLEWEYANLNHPL